MDWLVIIVNEFRHVFSVLIAELLLVLPSTEKRNNFALRISLCAAVCCILCPLYAVFYIYLHDNITVISVFWYTIIFLVTGGVIAVCFKIKTIPLLWVMIAAYAVEHFVYVLINEIIFIGIAEYSFFNAENKLYFWLSLLANTATCALTYYAFYRIFKPNINYLGKYLQQDNWKNRLFFGIFLLVFFASTLLNQRNAQTSEGGLNYLSAVSDLINCLFVLIVQFISLTTSKINFEKQVADKLFEDAKRQYETFKNSVDYINIKCHDLKHELSRIQKGGAADPQRLEEIAEGVALYEAFAKTGNETLDVVLTEKNLACISNGISLSCMADASDIAVMEAGDIYTLFGNLLDNAIEYLQKVEDREKRFIRLFVRSQGGMLLIHEENYFDGPPQALNGALRTTKGDAVNHGFGIKSMTRTANRYGGDLKISAEDGVFKVDIFIRIKGENK